MRSCVAWLCGGIAAVVGSLLLPTTVAAQTAQTITFAALGGKTYGNAPFTVSATASSGLAVTFSSLTTAVCTVSGSTVTIVAAGGCTIRASQAGDATYAPAPNVDRPFTVAKAAQTITFTAPTGKTYGDAPFALTATASSGLAVTYTSLTTAICTVSGSTLTIVAAGSCQIRASQAGNANYNAATNVDRTFAIAKKAQTITFNPPATKTYGDAPFAVTATATSGLAVAFASTTATICTVSGATVTIVAAGTCTIRASQAGNANYLAAPNVDKPIAVAKKAQTITFAVLPALRMDQVPAPLSATASSGLAVVFTSATTTICTVSGTTITLKAVGTCTINANQAGNANYLAAPQLPRSFVVSKGNQTITFGALPPKTYKDPNFAVSATASSGLAVTFSSLTPTICTVSGTTVTLVGAGTCTIQAAQAGNANWNAAANVPQSFAVAKAAQTITFNAPAAKPLGSAPFAVSATSTSTLAVTFASTTTSVCTTGGTNGATVTLVAMGTCSITASQAGNANYLAATPVSRSFAVTAANQTITFPVLPPKLWGDPPFAIAATASSGLPVAFFSQSPTVCSVSGATVTLLAVGECAIEAYQDGNASNGPAYAARSFPVIKPIKFAPTVYYPQPGDPTAIALADTSGDGRPDVLLNRPLTVFPANADGTLASRIPGRTDLDHLEVLRLVTADFNRDGKPDVAALVRYPDDRRQVWTFLATGSNAFGPGTIQLTGYLDGIVAADFDQDGNADLAIGSELGAQILLSDGAGGFRRGVTPPVGGNLIAVTDFNNDGKPDLVVASSYFLQYCVSTGKGDGTFNWFCFSTTETPTAVVVGDFNRDGNPDFALTKLEVDPSFFWTRIALYLGKGNGTFFAPTDFLAAEMDVGADLQLAAGDFNGDGRPDIVLAAGGYQSILTGAGDGTFFPPLMLVNDGTQRPAVVVPDLNGDGRSDLVLAGYSGDVAVAVMLATDTVPSSTTIVAQSGTPQLAKVGTPYALLFSALVRNGGGQPLANQQVRFAAPTTGPAGTFAGGSASVTVETASDGVATAPAFTANFTAGSFNVVASTGSASAAFVLTNGDDQLRAPAFLSGPPSGGSLGVPYSFLVVTSGSPAPTITTPAGSLPTGLALSGAGLISGTPTAAGVFAGMLTANNGVDPQATQAFAISIAGAVQVINFGPPGNRVFTSTPFAVSATASSGLPVTFASTTPTICTVSGNMVTLLTAGTCTIRASQAGNASYAAAAVVNQNIVVGKIAQAITFDALIDRMLGSGTFAVTASATSGLAVAFTSSTPTVCTVSGTTVTLVAAGTCTLTAAQAGNALYAAATSVPRSFAVVPSGTNLPPTIGFVTPANGATYGAPAIVPMLVTTADGDGSVARVEFYNGAVLLGSSKSAPFGYVWSGVAAGTYAITAKAFDNLGAMTSTASVGITVGAAATHVSFARRDTPFAQGLLGAMGVADITGDGKPDLLMETNCPGCQVYAYRGDGAGAFSLLSQMSPASGLGSVEAALVELDTNARTDFVSVDSAFPYVSVTLVNTDGTLRTSVGYPISQRGLGVTAADFNGDGKRDVAVALTGGNIALLRGNGDGTLQAAVDITLAGNPSAIAAGDVDGDGKVDLVVSDVGDGMVRVLRGNGDGTFQAAVAVSTSAGPGDSPYRLVLADVNGDSKLDIVFTNFYEPAVTVALGNGNGTFQPPVDYPSGPFPAGVAVADLNADGKKDLVVANSDASGTVSVLYGNGNGTFQAPRTIVTGSAPEFVVAVDVNNDGKIDIVVDSEDSLLSVFVNIQGMPTSAPVFTNGPLPTGTIGQPYTFRFTASGVPTPSFTWTPSGPTAASFTLTPDGLLSGSPGPNIYTGTVRATNGIAPDATQAFSFIVRPAVGTIDFTLPEYIYWEAGRVGNYDISLDRSLRYETLTPSVCTIVYSNGPDWTLGGYPALHIEMVGVCTVRASSAASSGTTPPVPVVRSTTVINYSRAVTITSPPDRTAFTAPANIVVAIDAKTNYGGFRPSDVHPPHMVVVKLDGGTGCTANTSPFTCTINGVGAGNRTLVATSYQMVDGYGSISTDSPPVVVRVQGAAPLPATTITSPVANATFFAPATIPITVTATDPASTIVSVQYFNGPQPIGTATTAPYTFNWTAVPTGTYTLIAKATSASGLVTASPGVTVTVEPSTAPVGALFDFNATWDATGFVKDAVAGHQLQKLGNVTQVAAPAAGVKPDSCKAASFAGGTLDIDDFPVLPDPGARTGVAFWMYWNGANSAMPFSWQNTGLVLLNGHFGFTTSGTDVYGIASTGLANGWHHVFAEFNNGSVTANRLYVDGVAKTLTQRVGTPVLANAYASDTWRLGGKIGSTAFTFTGQLDELVIVYGAVSPAQASARATAPNPCAAVSVSLLAPAPNASFLWDAAINLVAAASTQGGQNLGVAFYRNGTYIGSGTNSTYGPATTSSFEWRNVQPGTYSITAVASDNLGGTATTAPVTVNVVAPKPTATVTIQMPMTISYSEGSTQFEAKPVMEPGYEKAIVTIYVNGSPSLWTSLDDLVLQMKFAYPGVYTIVAEVMDKWGNKSLSEPFQLTVLAGAPPLVYYYNDAAGTPVATSDASGNLFWQQKYEPYGAPLDSSIGRENEILYTGKPTERSTGLSYYGARWYDPGSGRFMSTDPVSFREGNPKSFNRYAYANNNPYTFADPDGRWGQLITTIAANAAAGALIGGGMTAANNALNQAVTTGDVQVLGAGGVMEAFNSGAVVGAVFGAVFAPIAVTPALRWPYRRDYYGGSKTTNNPVADAIRAEAEGQPCPLCGNIMQSGTKHAPSPQHEPTLFRHFQYGPGKQMTQAERVEYATSGRSFNGANCLVCQHVEGQAESVASRILNRTVD